MEHSPYPAKLSTPCGHRRDLRQLGTLWDNPLPGGHGIRENSTAWHRHSDAEVTDVSHVFFTHLHYDHCLDYARLLLTRWDQE